MPTFVLGLVAGLGLVFAVAAGLAYDYYVVGGGSC